MADRHPAATASGEPGTLALDTVEECAVGLDRQVVADVLTTILGVVPDTDVRLVGTASSVLRGMALPANDIDILFRDRADVDDWCTAVAGRGLVVDPPSWLDDSMQYFARTEIRGVPVEFSTVEIETRIATMECFGSGPWTHFDQLSVGDSRIGAVVSELRLATEVARGRRDRWQPIARYLAATSCDFGLLRQALVDHLVQPDVVAGVLTLTGDAEKGHRPNRAL